MKPQSIELLLLDFDGVIVDSVLAKEQVFKAMIEERLPQLAPPAMEYFWSHGGTSRVEKFRWIFANLAKAPLTEEGARELGDEFARRVRDAVIACPMIKGAREFLDAHHSTIKMFVISGTPQPELRDIVEARGLSPYFRGVFGSPRSKSVIAAEILGDDPVSKDRVRFVGDATTDRDAARAIGVGFVGIHGPHLTPFVDGDETMIDDLTALPRALGLE